MKKEEVVKALGIEINENFEPTGKFKVIELNEEEYKKYRIIEELASMAIESNPLLNAREELKNVPLVYWKEEDFESEENEKINEILDGKNVEFEGILTDKLDLDLKDGEGIYFGDFYNPTEEQEKQNVKFSFMYSVYSDKPKKQSLTVNELIQKLQELPESMKNVEVDIAFEDEEGNGEGFPLHFVSFYEASDDDDIPSHVSLTYSEFNEEESEQDRIENIESGSPIVANYQTMIGEVVVYEVGSRKSLVHILTCEYGGVKRIVKETLNGLEI